MSIQPAIALRAFQSVNSGEVNLKTLNNSERKTLMKVLGEFEKYLGAQVYQKNKDGELEVKDFYKVNQPDYNAKLDFKIHAIGKKIQETVDDSTTTKINKFNSGLKELGNKIGTRVGIKTLVSKVEQIKGQVEQIKKPEAPKKNRLY